ncbi:MAG: hypothetical protein U0W40_02335 [Acidimicrobiia bacterium]
MKVVSKGLLGLGAVALAAAPLAWSALDAAVPAGAQAVEPIVVQFKTVGTGNFEVPADVHCLAVDAIGGSGGSSYNNGSNNGGSPGEVQTTIVVAPGESLQVNVGGVGGDGNVGTGGAGGFNGGGEGGNIANIATPVGGGGGGGASDVRRAGATLADRVVVGAGGGGGGAFGTNGGAGGDPGNDGSSGTTSGGGGGAIDSTPGLGGVDSNPAGIANGQNGFTGIGGEGGGWVLNPNTNSIRGGGGGGGGGLAGGGGGAGVADSGAVPAAGDAGAGGGGSNLDDGVFGNSFSAEWVGDGQVTLSYVPGDVSCFAAPLTVTKALAGAPLPAAGTAFTMQVACDDSTIDLRTVGGTGNAATVTLDYVVGADGTAQPVGTDTIGFGGPTQCTVTETVAGGAASTSFTCLEGPPIEIPNIESAGSFDELGATAVTIPRDAPACPAAGPSGGGIQVTIARPQQTATVTVTNTYAAAAAGVVAQPRFTG